MSRSSDSVAHDIVPPPRLPNESPDAYSRFLQWLSPDGDLPRSMARTARDLGLNRNTLAEQAERYEWKARAISHDRRAIEAEAQVQNKLAVEAGRDSLALIHQLRDRLAAIVAEAEDADDPAVFVQLALDASKVLDRLIRNERLILGLSTSHSAVTVNEGKSKLPDLRHLTTEQLQISSAGQAVEAIANKQELSQPDRAGLAHLEALLRWLPLTDRSTTLPAERKRRWAEVYGTEP